jgi:hypothetical protein
MLIRIVSWPTNVPFKKRKGDSKKGRKKGEKKNLFHINRHVNAVSDGFDKLRQPVGGMHMLHHRRRSMSHQHENQRQKEEKEEKREKGSEKDYCATVAFKKRSC